MGILYPVPLHPAAIVLHRLNASMIKQKKMPLSSLIPDMHFDNLPVSISYKSTEEFYRTYIDSNYTHEVFFFFGLIILAWRETHEVSNGE